MSIAIIANGTLLKKGDGTSSPETFTTIPEVMRLSGPSIRFDLLDVTSHDSSGFFREFIPGLADGDNVTADFNWRPSNTIHIDLRDDSLNRTLGNYQVVFPDTSENTLDFQSYVAGLVPKADIGTVLMQTLTLKVTGLPVWS